MKYFTFLLFCFVGVVIISLFVPKAMEKQARIECNTWTEQAKLYPSFYLTEAQGAQCEVLGVQTYSVIVAQCHNDENGTQCQERLGDKWEVIYNDGKYRGERY